MSKRNTGPDKAPVITTEAIRHLIDTPLARIANSRAGDPLGRGDVRGWLIAMGDTLEEYQNAVDAMADAGAEIAGNLVTDLQRRIVSLHAAGQTVKEIHEETGCSRSHVMEILGRLNLTPNVRKAQIPELQRRQVLNAYKAGKRGKQIVEAVGLSNGQVRAVLRWGARRGEIEYSVGG